MVESTPAKMYNANVSCAILLSFVKSACIKDIDDHCKQKNIQLGIELDALRKVLQQTHRGLMSADGVSSTDALSTMRSTAASSSGAALPSTGARAASVVSRPLSGASRPTTPGATRSSSGAAAGSHSSSSNANGDDESDEYAAALAQKEVLEKQLEVVNAAARYAKGSPMLCMRLWDRGL